jgi:inhibitor of KinA
LSQRNTEMAAEFEIMPLGDGALLVEFGTSISPRIHKKVKSLTNYLDKNSFPGMIEYVAAFTSVTVFYDPVTILQSTNEKKENKTAGEIVDRLLREIIGKLDGTDHTVSRVVEIPVCYGGEFGPDLEFVARHNKLSPEKVIEIHTGGEYLVYMIGFAPGFPYLGGMSERIATPRRQSPRTSIPAGSVGIAGMQTGAYPISTPGGWQLIGRTPTALFRPQENPPSLLNAGDTVKFYSISNEEYQAMRGNEA